MRWRHNDGLLVYMAASKSKCLRQNFNNHERTLRGFTWYASCRETFTAAFFCSRKLPIFSEQANMFCFIVQWNKKRKRWPLRIFRGHGGWSPDQRWSMWCLTVVAKGYGHEQCVPRLHLAPESSINMWAFTWSLSSVWVIPLTCVKHWTFDKCTVSSHAHTA